MPETAYDTPDSSDAGRFLCGKTLTSMVQWELEMSARKGYEITVEKTLIFTTILLPQPTATCSILPCLGKNVTE